MNEDKVFKIDNSVIATFRKIKRHGPYPTAYKQMHKSLPKCKTCFVFKANPASCLWPRNTAEDGARAWLLARMWETPKRLLGSEQWMEESVSYSLSLFLSVNLLSRSPMWGHGPRHVGFLLILCQAQKWAAGSEAEQLARELVSIRDARTTGGSFICYASLLVPGSIFLKPKIFVFY